MKLSTMNMTLAVAGLVLAAGTASAQTMKAEIPFAFRVGKQVMQPGLYQVSVLPSDSSTAIVKISNYDSKRSTLLLPQSSSSVPKAWVAEGAPKLRFACSDGPCMLAGMWSGEGTAYVFHAPHGNNGEPRIAEIAMRPERASD